MRAGIGTPGPYARGRLRLEATALPRAEDFEVMTHQAAEAAALAVTRGVVFRATTSHGSTNASGKHSRAAPARCSARICRFCTTGWLHVCAGHLSFNGNLRPNHLSVAYITALIIVAYGSPLLEKREITLIRKPRPKPPSRRHRTSPRSRRQR
ncbi:MAG: hypothetical protein ACLTSX_11520 [Collinsella sp.]